ncbi:MAG: hypothetical protein GY851_04475 [bacterium]|nr:hypothetical protein [bacterium]
MTRLFENVRLTELGKIKIGGLGEARKAKSGNTYRQPVKSDHFTVTTTHRGPDVGGARGDLVEDVDLMDQLKQDAALVNHDGNLIRLPIFLLSNRISDILQTSYVWYGGWDGGSCVGARAQVDFDELDDDGAPTVDEVTWFYDRTNGKKLKEPITEPWDDAFLELTNSKGALLFKAHTVFNCVIGAQQARWGGIYKFRTTGKISAEQLYSGLLNLSGLTNGILRGLPLCLFIRPIRVSPQGKPMTVYAVGVEMRGPDMQAILDMARDAAKQMLERGAEIRQIEIQQRRMLVAPGFEGGDDAYEINQEFSPGTVDDLPKGDPEDTEFWEQEMAGSDEPIDVTPEPEPEPEPVDADIPENSDEAPPTGELFDAEGTAPCSVCGKPFSLNEDKCPHCGNELPF